MPQSSSRSCPAWPAWSAAGLILFSVCVTQGCDSLPLLAPTDTTIVVVASDPVIALDGESVITALVTESAGTPVQNGTLVTFSTTLGTVDPQESRTLDGRATTRLRAGKTAGTATVSAFSGASTSNTVPVQIGSAPAGP